MSNRYRIFDKLACASAGLAFATAGLHAIDNEWIGVAINASLCVAMWNLAEWKPRGWNDRF